MRRRFQWVVTNAAIVAAFAGVVGCGFVPSLPASFEVATSATEKTEVEAGTGPVGLANSTWSLVRKADPADADAEIPAPSKPPGPYGGILSGRGLERPPVGERVFLVRFGANGEMTEAAENRFFLANIYGSIVSIGGEWTASTIPGIAFRSESYGLQIIDRFGVAVVVHVRFGNFFLGRAVLYSWGTIADDVIEGQFGYLLDFTDGVVRFLGTVADQYPVEGTRSDSESSAP